MEFEILNAVKSLGLPFHCTTPCSLVSDKMFKISKKPASPILKVDFEYILGDISGN
jgi:sulfopyruvate decarboxylase TPP-binding subunit